MKNTGKSDIVLQQIVNAIHSGEYPAGGRMPCGVELAEKYGVAHLTMRRVLERLKAHNYITMRPREGIYVRSRPLLKHAVVVMEYADDPHALFPTRLQRALVDAGCIINVFDARVLTTQPEVFLNAFAIPQDYLIFCGFEALAPRKVLDRVPGETCKIMFHSCEYAHPPEARLVIPDHFDAGYQSVRALVEFGRTRLAVFANETIHDEYSVNRLFFQGINRAAEDFGIRPPHPVLSEEVAHAKLTAMLESGRYDGVVAAQDSFLIPVIEAAERLRISIPNDLALVGHNNTPWAEQYNLTSVDLQPAETVRKIVEIIQGRRRQQETVVPAKIVYRKSCPRTLPS